MRPFHRILAMVASLLMLYLAVTGTWIQLLDLRAVLGGAPESDATMLSINEGKFGNRDYAVVSQDDFDASPLPTDLAIGRAFATTLEAVRPQAPGRDLNFAEIRVVDGVVVGQAQFGGEVKAAELATGAAISPLVSEPMYPPESTRQSLKEWHRFWSRNDKPAVYFELLSGLIMCTLIGTGLIIYFRLLKQRRKIGRPGLVWLNGGLWRGLHRAISVVAAVFIIAVAISGTLLGFESSWHTFVNRSQPEVPATLSDAEVMSMAQASAAALHATAPDVPIRVLRVRKYHGMKQGVAITQEDVTRQLVFDTDTGKQVSLTEDHYPPSGFPFGLQMHENIKHFHSGFLFGLPARMISLLAGLALIYLSISGIVMYFEMWAKRRKAGRLAFFWKG